MKRISRGCACINLGAVRYLNMIADCRCTAERRFSRQHHVKVKCLILHMTIPEIPLFGHRNKVIKGLRVVLGKNSSSFILEGKKHVHNMIRIFEIDLVALFLEV